MNMMKKIGVSLLTIALTLSVFLPNFPFRAVEAAMELVNVAPEGTVSTENGENGNHVIGNVNDGKVTTSWQTQGVWPSQAVINLGQGRTVSEIVVELGEDGDNSTGRSCLVTIQYAQNGVIDTLLDFGSQRMTVDSRFTFKADTPKSATHIFVTLSDPQDPNNPNPGFWPSVQEIEVYELQDVKLSNYNNIANQSTISVTGGNEHGSEGSKNLVDNNYKSLYKYYNAAQTSEQTITLKYDEVRTMDAFQIVFEEVGNPDPNSFSFEYSILARNGSGDYDTIVSHATANRTDNFKQNYSIDAKNYDEVQIVMHSCKAGANAGWPAIAEFEIYGNEIEVTDEESVAFKKPVHTSSNASTAANITDGSTKTSWSGIYYPSYVDIDLEENYILDEVQVFTPTNGYSQYSIYTSMNGRDFQKLAEKTSTESTTADGDSYSANQREARIVRVYLEYNSASTLAVLNEVRVKGTKSNTPIQTRPEVAVKPFNETAYATGITVTAQETINEVFGIIERQVGPEYKNWFLLELANNPNGSDYDYFELSMSDGKVYVKGNDGVSLAMGINHYLKYFCNVNISQVGNQNKMPDSIVPVNTTVHKETKAKVRYSYNYCTLSYSMAFWGENEWRNELDWLALNGVNVVLDATAQEEVWRRFLGRLGYSHADIKDYIAGPAYYAWAYMANLSGFGGPVHDSWFEERTELARKNQEIMRNLGMQPVLQGYSGMVPTNITSLATGQYALTSSDIIGQGSWCSFQRPAMLRTTSAAFDKYAALFYECQEEVYGATSDYYATDPFHEGGNTGGMNSTNISREVLTSMLEADKDAIWIIQAWQGNPTTDLLNGLDEVENGASHALVLDLYAEKTPHHGETGNSYGNTDEFDDTPWLYCMLNNFGGRLGLHGHLDNMAKNIPSVFNNRQHVAGIGITPEASVNNPVLYDFLFESIWVNDASQSMSEINLDTWLDDYATRRYGAESESANAAWDILKETVYKSSLNNRGQGAPESIVNARPAMEINAASTWGNAIVGYEKGLLEEAAELLLKDYDKLSSSAGYMYDVANVLQQVLSNSAQEYHNRMVAALNAGDKATFASLSETFLAIIDQMEKVTATTEYFLLGRWVEQAKALGANADDFTKELYEFNAKALVTTWGSYNQCESGGLKDYSNRQWSGLIGDFYKPRWERWINAKINDTSTDFNWFQWEWEWVRGNKVYSTTPTAQDLEVLGKEILKKYTSSDPNADASNDIPNEEIINVSAGTAQPLTNGNEGPVNLVIDYDKGTIWHSAYGGSTRDQQHIIFTFNEVKDVDSMRFLQRSGGPNVNGIVNKFSLYYRADTTGEWIPVKENVVPLTNHTWQIFEFDTIQAKEIKFQVHEAYSTSSTLFAAAAEIHFTRPVSEDDDPVVDDDEEPVVKEEQSVTLDKPVAKLEVGNTLQLEVKVLPETEENQTVQWTTSDSEVATVVDGLVTAKKSGSVTITVTTSEGKKSTCEIFVEKSGTDIILNVGESYAYENTNGASDFTDDVDDTVISKEETYNSKINLYDHASNTANSLTSFSTTANENIAIEDALFTITSVENTTDIYTIYNAKTNTYLTNANNVDRFFNADAINMKIAASTESGVENSFNICKEDGTRYIIFYNNEMNFNSNSGFSNNYGAGSYHLILLKAKDTVSCEDVLPGFEQVNTITSGESYLIAYKNNLGVFVLYPSNGKANQTKHANFKPYHKVYEIGSTTVTNETLANFHITFTQSEQGISMQTSDGKYMSNTGTTAILTTDQKFFAFESCTSRAGKYHIKALNGSNDSYYYFHTPDANINVNRMSSYQPNSDGSSSGNYDFMIFEQVDTYDSNDLIPGYAQVTDLTTIDTNKKYILVNEETSGTYKGVYVVAPTGTIGNKNSLRKIEKGDTHIVFTALDYGTDTVEINGEALNFYVLENLAYQKNTSVFWNDGTQQPIRDTYKGPSHVTDGRSDDFNGYLDFGRDNDTRGSYIEIDLLNSSYIKTIDLYRYWNDSRTYRNTVIAVSNDKDFYTYKVVYNTDTNNVHGFGVGTDQTYRESANGKSFNVDTTARYIRVYMNGQDDSHTTNHVVEVRAFGYTETPKDIVTSTIMRTRDYTHNGDYLFEGYYTDGHGLNAVTKDLFIQNISYVAKYVTPKVLSVKAQSKIDAADGKLDVRFVSSVASGNLEQVGFKVEVLNGNTVTSTQFTKTEKVYNKVVSNVNNELLYQEPDVVFENDASKHFFVAKLNNVPEAAKSRSIRVTPYWLPLGCEDVEANYVEGVERTFTVQQLFDAAPEN